MQSKTTDHQKALAIEVAGCYPEARIQRAVQEDTGTTASTGKPRDSTGRIGEFFSGCLVSVLHKVGIFDGVVVEVA